MTVFEDIIPLLNRLNKRQKLRVMQYLIEDLAIAEAEETTMPNPEELGWPPNYFTETFGAFQDDPLERPAQGEFEVRDQVE